jgi:peptide/nickel transport system substrate-binding protein
MSEKKLIWLPNNAVTRRQIITGGAATAAAAALAACGGEETGSSASTTAGETLTSITAVPDTTAPTGGIKKGGILRMGTLGGANDLLDGQQIVSKADIARIVTGWEGLLNFDPAYNIVTDDSIAEEVESVSADKYVVRLKEGILFADGKPVTAEDVIYSFNRLLDPELAVFGGSALRPILDPSGVVKIDERTVEITLKQPVATFPEALCGYTSNIVPVGYERFAGDPTNQIGTGPFVLKEFEIGVQSIHVRNEYYWQPDKPYFDEVHIIDFADSDAMVNALLADQIDVCADIPATAVESITGAGMSVLNSAGGGWTPIFMAVDIAPFTDNKVRQAMRLIPNRQAMIDEVAGGYGTIANDLFAPLDACYIGDELPQRDQDLDQANALLAEAGNPELPALLAPNDTAGLPEIIQAFAAMAAEGGITIDAQVVDGGIYWGDEYLKRPFGTDFWGTRNFLAQCAAGELPTAPYPDTHWPPEGSTFVDDYNAAVAETDLDKRKVITDKMQTELYETGGLIIPFFGNQLDGFNPRLQGLVERPNTLNLDHYGRGYKNLYFSE